MEFKISSLDTTATGGGVRREAEYHQAFLGAPLRGRYRIGGRAYKKGGSSGNGNSGKAKHKVAQKGQLPPKPVVLVLDAATGRRRFEDA